MYRICLLLFVIIPSAAPATCFHGSTYVQTGDGSVRTIAELAKYYPNAKVLTASGRGKLFFSPIKYWLHANPTIKSKFLEIRTDANKLVLSITPDHLIYRIANETISWHYRQIVQAGELRVGDFVLVHTTDRGVIASRIIDIRTTQKEGIYAPVTEAGSLIVNNVLASSFVIVKNEYVQHFFLDTAFGLRQMLQYWLPSSYAPVAFNGIQTDVPYLVLKMLELAESIFA